MNLCSSWSSLWYCEPVPMTKISEVEQRNVYIHTDNSNFVHVCMGRVVIANFGGHTHTHTHTHTRTCTRTHTQWHTQASYSLTVTCTIIDSLFFSLSDFNLWIPFRPWSLIRQTLVHQTFSLSYLGEIRNIYFYTCTWRSQLSSTVGPWLFGHKFSELFGCDLAVYTVNFFVYFHLKSCS